MEELYIVTRTEGLGILAIGEYKVLENLEIGDHKENKRTLGI